MYSEPLPNMSRGLESLLCVRANSLRHTTRFKTATDDRNKCSCSF